MKKRFQSALFSPLGQWTGNNFVFKGDLRVNYQAASLALILYCPWTSCPSKSTGPVLLSMALLNDMLSYIDMIHKPSGQWDRAFFWPNTVKVAWKVTYMLIVLSVTFIENLASYLGLSTSLLLMYRDVIGFIG